MNKNPLGANLPVEPFGTQSSSKFQHFGGIPVFGSKTDWRDDLVENPKLNPKTIKLLWLLPATLVIMFYNQKICVCIVTWAVNVMNIGKNNLCHRTSQV